MNRFLFACAPLLTFVAMGFSAENPLAIGTARLEAVRAAIAKPGHHQTVYQTLKTQVEGRGKAIVTAKGDSYDRAYMAANAAGLYLVSRDKAHAALSFELLKSLYDHPGPDPRRLDNGSGLSKATISMCFAFSRDWCADAWTAEQKKWVDDLVEPACVAWVTFGHINISGNMASNWSGVTGGGELLLNLISPTSDSRKERLESRKKNLIAHMNTYGKAGWNQEGPIYIGYTESYMIPAALAMETRGDASLIEAMRKHEHWQVPMYIAAANANQNAAHWSAGATTDKRGWLSLMLATVPQDRLAGYQWFYDRARGVANPAPAAQKFDNGGMGRIWSLFLYPTTTQPTDPAAALPIAIKDEGGAWMRSGWKDQDDVIVTLHSDSKKFDKAWNYSDAGVVNLLFGGAQILQGPSQSEDPSRYTQMLIGGQAMTTSQTVGGPIELTVKDRVAVAAVRGGDKFSALGANKAVRTVHADFTPGALHGLVAIHDVIDSKATELTWNGNIGDGVGAVVLGEEGGLPTVLFEAKDGAWVKGWLLSSVPGKGVSTRPLQFSFAGASVRCALVLSLSKGFVPVAQVEGSGARAVLHVAGKTFALDGDSLKVGDSATTFALAGRASPMSGKAPFSTTVSADKPGTWSVAGAAVTGASAKATFAKGGVHWVPFTAEDGGKRASILVLAEALNTAPDAAITVNRTFGPAPLTVRFDAGASRDKDGHPMTFSWDFGDGTRATGAVVEHTYDGKIAEPRVVLSVDDGAGGISAASVKLFVGNRRPDAIIAADRLTGPPPLTVALDAGGSTDPEGDALSYAWDLGNGAKADGAKASATYDKEGTYAVNVTVKDAGGAISTSTVRIDVRNLPPTAAITLGKSVGKRGAPSDGMSFGKVPLNVTFNVVATDPEGGPVTATWDFGDGTTATGLSVDHTFTKPGLFMPRVTVVDALGAKANASTSIDAFDATGLRQPDTVTSTVAGLQWRNLLYLKGSSTDTTTIDSGVIDQPTPTAIWAGSGKVETEFEGWIDIPADGAYTFHLTGNCYPEMYIGAVTAFKFKEEILGRGEVDGPQVLLKRGLHRMRMTVREDTDFSLGAAAATAGTPWVFMRWSGPGFERTTVPRSAWRRAAEPSKVRMVADRLQGQPPLKIRFDGGTSTFGANDPLATCTWDFGDGTTGDGITVEHVFSKPGFYFVRMTGIATSGRRVSVSSRVDVDVIRPAIDIGAVSPGVEWGFWPSEGNLGHMPDFRTLEFDSVGTAGGLEIGTAGVKDNSAILFKGFIHVPETGVYDFRVYSDDGSSLLIDDTPVVSRVDVTYPYFKSGVIGLAQGMHRFEMRYFEAGIGKSLQVQVRLPGRAESEMFGLPREWLFTSRGRLPNAPPTVQFTPPTGINQGVPTVFAATGADPDRDPLVFDWDFGDGNRGSGRTPTYRFVNPGVYTVTVQARDGRGGVAKASAQIEVKPMAENRPPVGTISAIRATSPDGRCMTVSLDASAITDPDGDPLHVTWLLGDGTATTAAVVRRSYAPGEFTANVQVSDGKGGTLVQAVPIRIDGPTAPLRGFCLSDGGRGVRIDPSIEAGLFPLTGWMTYEMSPSARVPKGASHPSEYLFPVASATISVSPLSEGGNGVRITGSRHDAVMRAMMGLSKGDIVIKDIPYSRYDVVVLVGAVGIGSMTATINGTARTFTDDGKGLWDGVFRLAPDEPRANAAIWPELSGGTVTIQLKSNAKFANGKSARPAISGIQIIDRSGQ